VLDVIGQIDRALEAVIGNLHRVPVAPFFHGPVAAHAAQHQLAADDRQFDILGPHAGQLEFQQPSAPRAVHVAARLPDRRLVAGRGSEEQTLHHPAEVIFGHTID
jgi:hypothetical protein